MAIDVSQFAQNTAAITNSQSNAANSFVGALLQREQQKAREQQLLQEQLLKQQEARTNAEMEQASDPAYILSLVRQGVQPTPQQQAILDIESAKAQRAFYDPTTGQLRQSGGFPAYQMPAQPPAEAAQQPAPQRKLDPTVAAEIAAEQNPARREQLVQQGNQSLLSGVESPMVNTPIGQKELFEKQLDVAAQKELKQFDAAQLAEVKDSQSLNVQIILDRMGEINDTLMEKGGIVAVRENGLFENIKAAASSSGIGQLVSKVTDPELQALRNEYNSLQSTLLPFYAKSAGLGTKSIDSDGERKSILESFGDPSSVYESNKQQLLNLSELLGTPPVTVTTQQEYDALPSGTIYIEDGTKYRKP